MKIYEGTTDFHIEGPSAVAIGKFDGVHKGHRIILQKLLQYDVATSVVMTFDPSPEIFLGFGPDKELSTREEKRRLFEALGVDVLVEFPFNHKTAATPPEDFIRDYLVDRLHAAYIVAGADLSFGDRGAGNFELLRAMEKQYGYKTSEVPKMTWNDQVISSTLIRSLVGEGRMEDAAECLGAPYSVLGEIVHGNAIGRTLDIPTINLVPEEGKLLPPFGVYYSHVWIDKKRHFGMTNIGMKPTIHEGSKRVTAETYLYDFSEDVYGKEAEVMLLTYKRPEIKFDGIEALKAQMREDVAAGRVYHGIR